MKPHQIKEGETYCNGGAGRTIRKVIGVGPEHVPKSWAGTNMDKKPADGSPGVRFMQDGEERCLYLDAFAKWAGRKVR